MPYIILGSIIVGCLLGLVLGYIIGKLWGELKVLREQAPKRRSNSDIALFEDAVAVVADLRYRQRVEEYRNEAVREYFDKRMAGLVDLLGNARNGGEYKSKPSKRPNDY